MAIDSVIIPQPAYNVLRRLTGESRPEVALSLALKELVRLRLEAARAKIAAFERKYEMTFGDFQKSWQEGRIPKAHTHAVETDYWNWEAATTDVAALEELAQWVI